MIDFADGRQFLFDLASDPGEVNDLSAALPERAKDLLDSITAWEKEILP